MLPVSAFKFGDPVVFGVEMVADDLALHVNVTAVERGGAEWAESSDDFGSLVVGDEPPLARLAPERTRARAGFGMSHLYAQGKGGAREKLLWFRGVVIPSPSG
jgi:hypothetical protein